MIPVCERSSGPNSLYINIPNHAIITPLSPQSLKSGMKNFASCSSDMSLSISLSLELAETPPQIITSSFLVCESALSVTSTSIEKAVSWSE